MVEIKAEERDEFDDLLGSGGIFRKFLLNNPEGIQAEFGEELSIKYSERLYPTGQIISQDQLRKFRVGDGEIIPALELVSKMMRTGEVCEVRCDARFAYGDVGLEPNVPPGAAMSFIVELCRVGKKVTAEMSSSELIEEATKKKESGNRYYQQKNFEQAAKMYKRALKILEMWEHSEEEAAQCKELLIALGNNVANVQHKLEQHKEARQSSLEVLQLDGRSIKAMYRVAQIALEQSEFSEATEFAKKALQIEPNNTKFRELLVQVKKKKQKQRETERTLYSKLGGKGSAATVNGNGRAIAETKLSTAVRYLRSNPAVVATIVSALIAWAMYQFIGKPFHGMT